MKKEGREKNKIRYRNKKILASAQIFLLVSMSFAVAFALSESGIVSASHSPTALLHPGRVAPAAPAAPPAAPAAPAAPADPGAPAAPAAGIAGIVSKLFGGGLGGTWGPLISGVAWGATVAGLVQLAAPALGADRSLTNALTYAVLGGSVAGGAITTALTKLAPTKFVGGSGAATYGAIGGIVIGAAIFVLTYKSEKKKIVKFECLPWEAPIGGSKCEECNKDKFRPCSEYRCKALGQACQILNKGTKEEKCAWINPKDVTSPTITPWKDALKPTGLNYIPDTTIRPPALGVKVVRGTADCLKAFTPLEFGITTNEPAQCKIDFAHKTKMDDMEYQFGETNYHLYNHTQKLRLPGPETGTATNASLAPVLRNDGTFNLYVRCKDANGNENVDEFSFNFCVDKGPDTTPPVIERTSIPSGSPVLFNITGFPIEVYVNEPAECKWSRQNKAYTDMENTMSCTTQTYQVNDALLYTCSGNLTGIKNREDNKFYFRCKDQPSKTESERNVNVQSYELILKGSQPLNIIKVAPNATITGSTDTIPVSLEIETDDGAEEGKAYCYFSPTGAKDSYLQLFETNSFKHKQLLDLITGNYIFYYRCIDAGGNAAESNTTFSVLVDKAAPKVTRVYREGTDALKIITDEDAECVYSLNSCNYEFKDGLKLLSSTTKKNNFAEWKPGVSYYIKCRDIYGNEPNPNECSIVASASQLEAK